jgi:hypothetical protein
MAARCTTVRSRASGDATAPLRPHRRFLHTRAGAAAFPTSSTLTFDALRARYHSLSSPVQGLKTGTPARTKSATFLVTTHNPAIDAVAAMNRSGWENV